MEYRLMYEYSKRECFNVLTDIELNQLLRKEYGLPDFDIKEHDPFYYGGVYSFCPSKSTTSIKQLLEQDYLGVESDIPGILFDLIEKKKLPEGTYLITCE